jgi:hypothetical protein
MIKIVKLIVICIHLFIIFALIFGFFIHDKYLIYYLIIWPAIYTHWLFNDDQCMLTEIEYKLNDNHYNNIDEYRYNQYNSFLKQLKKYNIYFDNVDDYTTKIYTIASILWVIGFFRLLIFYRKNISNFWKCIYKTCVKRFICDTCKA